MKTLLKVTLLSFLLILSACDKTNEENELSSSLTSIKDGKTIIGKIENFAETGISSLKLYDEEDEQLFAEGNISSNGDFSLSLQTPTNLVNIQDYLPSDFEGEISDKTAFVTNDDFIGEITAFNGADEIGYVFKGNSNVFDDFGTPPLSVSLFIYSDRKTIVKGQDRSSEYSYYYDFTLYKGWNELVWKVLESTSTKHTVSISDAITLDMKWRFSKYEE